jgi:hypothetical protein
MKKVSMIALMAVALAAGACANKQPAADYTYETQAPYAEERTVGEQQQAPVVEHQAERNFDRAQRK